MKLSGWTAFVRRFLRRWLMSYAASCRTGALRMSFSSIMGWSRQVPDAARCGAGYGEHADTGKLSALRDDIIVL